MDEKKRYGKSMLSFVVLLSLTFFGCGTHFMGENHYETPKMPKSELAAIQIDTKAYWLQQNISFAIAINGKMAWQEKKMENRTVSIDDILVMPGTHDLSLLLLTEATPAGISRERQTLLHFSIDVKAGSTYLLKGDFANDTEDDLCFELIDTDTEEVVSELKTSDESAFDFQDSNDYSFQIGRKFHF